MNIERLIFLRFFTVASSDHIHPAVWNIRSLREDVFDRPNVLIAVRFPPEVLHVFTGHTTLCHHAEDETGSTAVIIVHRTTKFLFKELIGSGNGNKGISHISVNVCTTVLILFGGLDKRHKDTGQITSRRSVGQITTDEEVDQQLADFYYILVSYAKRLLMLNQIHNEQIRRSTLNTLQIQIAFTLFVGKGIRLVQNDTGIDCCIFSQLVQSGNRVLGDDLFIDIQHGRPGCNSAERILTVAFEEWSIELLPEGIVILPEETFLIRVFITEVRKDFSPAREIVVNITVAIDIQPGQKQVLDKID